MTHRIPTLTFASPLMCMARVTPRRWSPPSNAPDLQVATLVSALRDLGGAAASEASRDSVAFQEEANVVRRAQGGDRGAMEELLLAHSTQAFRLALQIVGNRSDAEDATQNAFVKAFLNVGSFDPQRPFASWLLKIVAREASNLRRGERRLLARWLRVAQPEAQADAEALVLVRAEHRELWQALQRLKDRDRLVLILAYLLELSEGEVATALGIRRGTVKSRKHNALVRLRALVESEFPGLQRALTDPNSSGSPTT